LTSGETVGELLADVRLLPEHLYRSERLLSVLSNQPEGRPNVQLVLRSEHMPSKSKKWAPASKPKPSSSTKKSKPSSTAKSKSKPAAATGLKKPLSPSPAEEQLDPAKPLVPKPKPSESKPVNRDEDNGPSATDLADDFEAIYDEILSALLVPLHTMQMRFRSASRMAFTVSAKKLSCHLLRD
jgi:hypothetical protein